MKRFSALIVFLFMAFMLSAQINLQDSTVQFVAYWQLGDKYKFDCEETNMLIINNDTTIVKKSTNKFVVEVVEATDSCYILSYDDEDENIEIGKKEPSELDKLFDNEEFKAKYDSIPLLLYTNQYGAYEGIANAEQVQTAIRNAYTEMKPDIIAAIKKEYENDKLLDAEATFNQIMQMSTRPEAFTIVISNFLQLLKYHGIAMSLDETIDWQEQRATIFGSKLIDVNCEAWIAKYNTDNSYVHIGNNNSYDSDQLLEITKEFINSITSEKIDTETPNDSPYIFMSDHLTVAIHTETGWPIGSYYEMVIESGGTKRVKIIRVNMAFEEE